MAFASTKPAGGGDVSIVPLRLGLSDEVGVILAACQRAGFPAETERLLLRVVTNQAAIGLQEAVLLSEQRRVASELDQRVEQRTRELAAATAQWMIHPGPRISLRTRGYTHGRIRRRRLTAKLQCWKGISTSVVAMASWPERRHRAGALSGCFCWGERCAQRFASAERRPWTIAAVKQILGAHIKDWAESRWFHESLLFNRRSGLCPCLGGHFRAVPAEIIKGLLWSEALATMFGLVRGVDGNKSVKP